MMVGIKNSRNGGINSLEYFIILLVSLNFGRISGEETSGWSRINPEPNCLAIISTCDILDYSSELKLEVNVTEALHPEMGNKNDCEIAISSVVRSCGLDSVGKCIKRDYPSFEMIKCAYGYYNMKFWYGDLSSVKCSCPDDDETSLCNIAKLRVFENDCFKKLESMVTGEDLSEKALFQNAKHIIDGKMKQRREVLWKGFIEQMTIEMTTQAPVIAQNTTQISSTTTDMEAPMIYPTQNMTNELECKKVRETLNLKLEVTVLGVSFMLMSFILCVMFHFHKKQIRRKENKLKNRAQEFKSSTHRSSYAAQEGDKFFDKSCDKCSHKERHDSGIGGKDTEKDVEKDAENYIEKDTDKVMQFLDDDQGFGPRYVDLPSHPVLNSVDQSDFVENAAVMSVTVPSVSIPSIAIQNDETNYNVVQGLHKQSTSEINSA